TLRANRITGLRRYYGLIRPCATHRDLVLVGLPLGPSLGIVTTGSHVLRESPNQAHAPFTPVTVKAVSRFRLDFIPGPRLEPGFDDVPTLSTPHQWFTGVRLLGSYLTASRPAVSGTLTTGTLNPSRFRRFGTWSCNPMPRDLPSSLTQHGASGDSCSRPFTPSWRTVIRIADQVDLVHPSLLRRLGEVIRQEPLQSIQGPVRQRG